MDAISSGISERIFGINANLDRIQSSDVAMMDIETKMLNMTSRLNALKEKRNQNENTDKKDYDQLLQKISEQANIINDQKDELEALTSLPTAYANRVGRSLLEKEDNQTLTIPYATCVRRSLKQSREIKVLQWSIKVLKRKNSTLAMELDIKSIEQAVSEMKYASNEAKNEAIQKYYVKTIEAQQTEIENLTSQLVHNDERMWQTANLQIQ